MNASDGSSKWDSSSRVVLIMGLLVLVFTLGRLAYGGWDPTRFVVAGDSYVDPAQAPSGLTVLENSTGYDGQFFYRLALDPFTSQGRDHGIVFDSPSYRQQRVVYPLMAWIVSGFGQSSAVPWALIFINIAALSSLAWFGTLLARRSGLHALWGLLLPGYAGFLVGLGRDTAEIVAAVLLVAGVWLIRERSFVPAAAVLTLAALARETSLLFPAAIGATWLVSRLSKGEDEPAPPPAYVAIVPVVSYALWLLVLRGIWGDLSFRAGAAIFEVPIISFLASVPADGFSGPAEVYSLGLIGFFMGFVVLGLVSISRSSACPWEKVALVFYVILVAMTLGSDTWKGAAWGLARFAYEPFIFSSIVILSAAPLIRWLFASPSAITWVVTAAYWVLAT